MRVSSALKSLIHGITTVATVLADKVYLREQINMQTVLGSGIRKRSPTTNVKAGLSSPNADIAYNPDTDFIKDFVLRDTLYFLRVRKVTPGTETEDDVVVYDENGNYYPVEITSNDYDYITNYTDRADIKISVHGDVAYVTNSTKTVELLDDLRVGVKDTLIRVNHAPPGGTVVSFTATTDATTEVHASYTVPTTAGANAVDLIAQNLRAAYNTAAVSGEIASNFGDTLMITLPDDTASDVRVSDSELLTVISNEVPSTTALPKFGIPEKIVEIRATGAPERTAVYMKSKLDKAAPTVQYEGEITWWFAGRWAYIDSLRWGFCHRTVQAVDGSDTVTYDLEAGTSTLGQLDGVDIACLATRYDYGETDFYNYFGRLILQAPKGVGFTASTNITRVTIIELDTGDVLFDENMEVDTEQPTRSFRSISNTVPLINNWSQHYGRLGVLFNFIGTPGATGNMSTITWQETSKPGERFKFNPETMPCRLKPTDIGAGLSFSLTSLVWDEKNAGNDINNPAPPFVDNTITNLSIFQNRLVALTADEVSTSETDNIYSFFRNTVSQSLPTHPVNIRSTVGSSATFTHTVNHNRDLMIFNPKAQFKLDGRVALTPETAGLPQISGYSNVGGIKPISLGNKVYYAFSYGDSLGISEHASSSLEEIQEHSNPLTDHIKGYLSNTLEQIDGDASSGSLILSSKIGELYVCDYDIKQSRAEDKRYAWSVWKDFLGDTAYTLESIHVDDTKVTMALAHSNQLDMVSLKIDQDKINSSGATYLDSQIDVVSNASGIIALPVGYIVGTTSKLIANYGGEQQSTEVDYTITQTTPHYELTITDTDAFEQNLILGRPYRASFKPNYILGRDEGGRVNDNTSIRILRWLLYLENSADVWASIDSPYSTIPDQYWSGLISGDLETITDSTANTSGTFGISFKQRGDIGLLEVHSDSHLPMNISEVEWIGNYISRGRRF